MKISNIPRARQFMYVQDLDHLKVSEKKLKSILEKSGAIEWAYIKHDKDKDEQGKIIRPHLHVVLKYDNPQLLSSVAKLFKDKDQYVQIWKGRINNAYSYLLHETSESQSKHHYSTKDVTASFDFESRMKKIRVKAKASPAFVNQKIEEFADRKITLNQLQQEIGIVQMAKHEIMISRIKVQVDNLEHKEWLKKFKGHRMKCLWLWGTAGVGKTQFAEYLLKNKKYAVLGSSKDYFENYEGEHFIIINDLRPNDIAYSDLLRILDPYQHDKAAPARYHDKKLNAEEIIITTPYDPQTFYSHTKNIDFSIDREDQLLRRIQPIHVTKKFILRAYKKTKPKA